LTDAAGINAEERPSAVDFLSRNQGAAVGDALLGAGNLLSGIARRLVVGRRTSR
jgi:hypothetical protein